MQDFNINYIEIIGLTAAVLTTTAFLPQVYKTWKTKGRIFSIISNVACLFYWDLILVGLWYFRKKYFHDFSQFYYNGIVIFTHLF